MPYCRSRVVSVCGVESERSATAQTLAKKGTGFTYVRPVSAKTGWSFSTSVSRVKIDRSIDIGLPAFYSPALPCRSTDLLQYWGNGDEVITSLVQTNRIVFFKISFFFCFCFFLQKFFSLYNWILVPTYGQMNHRCINMHRCMYGLIELKLHDSGSG